MLPVESQHKDLADALFNQVSDETILEIQLEKKGKIKHEIPLI